MDQDVAYDNPQEGCCVSIIPPKAVEPANEIIFCIIKAPDSHLNLWYPAVWIPDLMLFSQNPTLKTQVHKRTT